MRWYTIFCDKCGYRKDGFTAEQVANVGKRRCRICLELDSTSTKRLQVKEIVTVQGGGLIANGN